MLAENFGHCLEDHNSRTFDLLHRLAGCIKYPNIVVSDLDSFLLNLIKHFCRQNASQSRNTIREHNFALDPLFFILTGVHLYLHYLERQSCMFTRSLALTNDANQISDTIFRQVSWTILDNTFNL